MNPIIDNIMMILFVLFLFWVFIGYHKTKTEGRSQEEQEKGEQKNSEKLDS